MSLEAAVPARSITIIACFAEVDGPGRDPSILWYNNDTAATGIGYITNSTYYLNLKPLSFLSAEQFCLDRGGHLVNWKSLDEQVGAGLWLSP